MGKAKHKTYPKEDKSKETALRKKIKELENEIKRLKSELRTLEAAFTQTSKYLKDNTDGFSVRQVIEGVRKQQTLKQIQVTSVCKKCGSPDIISKRLPFGYLTLCKKDDCGYREVIKDGEETE